MDPSRRRVDAPQPPPLPAGLPVPADDGAAAHLPGRSIPSLTLRSSDGRDVELAELSREGLVLYVFPKIGRPHVADPPGWDDIPGARGCTQESCAFRDRIEEFAGLRYAVVGISAQPIEDLEEAAGRLGLVFPLLADPDRDLGAALDLPTFEFAGLTLYKRLTMVAREGRIAQVFYPVFPPDDHADEVLRWIRADAS